MCLVPRQNDVSLMSLSRWSGSAMALGNLTVPGRPTIWMIVGQGPTALAVGAGGVVRTFLLFYCCSCVVVLRPR